MATLTVHVNGSQDDDRVLAMMFDVVAPDGRLLAQGAASPQRPAAVQWLDTDIKRVYVIGYSPNGRTSEHAHVHELDQQGNHVYLDPAPSPHEWLQWVTPFRSLNHLQGEARAKPMRAIRRVWMVLWAFQEGVWAARSLDAHDLMNDAGMRQVQISVPNTPHLLQVGGDEVAWRFVSLPPDAEVRVALTRNRSLEEEFDSVEVTVGRVHPVNELIMSYLSRGAEVEAARLGEVWQTADLALFEKIDDPVSAAAGAYLLFKIGRLAERRSWVDKLVTGFPNLADGPIIAAALTMQCRGNQQQAVRHYLELAVERGVPLFSLGVSMLVETMAAAHRGAKESRKFKAAYQLARAYNQAQASSGAYFSFYGKSPALPSWLKYRGTADEPVPDQDDFVLSYAGDTESGRADFDATADSQRSQFDGGGRTSERSRPVLFYSVAAADPGSGAQVHSVTTMDPADSAVVTLKVEGSWLDQRQANAFMIFDGSDE